MRGQSVLDSYITGKFCFVKPSAGPISKSVNDLKLMLKALFNANVIHVDPTIAPVPWNENSFNTCLNKKRLNIGYVVSENLFISSDSSKRAVLETVTVLKELGHNLIPMQIPNFEKTILGIVSLITAEGNNRALDEALQGEEPVLQMKWARFIGKFPRWLRRSLAVLLRAVGEKRAANALLNSGGIEAHELLKKSHELSTLQYEFFDFWTANKLDCIILPAAAVPAVKHGAGKDLAMSFCHLWISSMFNLPSGVMPVTVVQKSEEKAYECEHKDNFSQSATENVKDSAGLPVCIQVLTLPWHDEQCAAIMKIIDDKINFSKTHKPETRVRIIDLNSNKAQKV
jgi:Asp-tRNA(Asn)/Glu-tRNA(Gln) amidotransferase A subunit family amidase